MNSSFEFKRISAKSIMFFLIFVSLVNFLLAQPLILLGFSKELAFFISTSISGTIGLTIVLTVIEKKIKNRKKILNRLLLSFVICTAFSYYLIYLLKLFS
ncbi:hypothetical protein ACQKP0_10085 [Heyndrickxia sp. NPDC080065]|uniref:hypothetical protein n=1 Tax=Heyndrickxia sp. NPDC080065 TaxID=3390568 RepID=UPI003D007D91